MAVSEHIGWLKRYVEGMTADNWADMRLRCERQLNELTAALSDQVVGWQPIETAPKDRNVLVVDRGVVSEAYYNGGSDTWWLANTAEHDFDAANPIYPELWQPLPAPPTPVPASTPVRSS